mmetsp:Transcript_16211/g.45949  ORF Transcript_16211/g.45949 Transcript_16211/m.45949 type:complete len:315 (-) Transcript_16211:73-1017(-)
MRRLLAVITAAAARPENATEYFDVASRLWPPASTAGRCLAAQRQHGWRPKPKGSNFKTLGTEGVGHHWLEGLPRRLCGGGGKLKRCGGQFSFSSCGGCCSESRVGAKVVYVKARSRARRGSAWRCFSNDAPKYPVVDKGRWHVVLVRDAVATQESILRRFWKFRDMDGGRVDTLHREEAFYAKAVARLEKAIKGLDCRRTFFLSYDLAARHPRAHAVAFAQFLGVAKVGFFRGSDNATTDCLTRVKPWLARLRAYAASDGRPADGGFDGVARACARGSSDRSCAAAWRRRAEACAAALGRKHPTVVPRLLATCA